MLIIWFRIRLKAELEQRERRLKEQVSSLSEKLSRGEMGSKDALSRKIADKGTVLKTQPTNTKNNKPQTRFRCASILPSRRKRWRWSTVKGLRSCGGGASLS